jgi:hypothetical protein
MASLDNTDKRQIQEEEAVGVTPPAYNDVEKGHNGPSDLGNEKSDTPELVAVALEEAAVIPKGTIDPVYEAKARVLNHAIQEIGMGWYQWQLFIVVGFGWVSYLRSNIGVEPTYSFVSAYLQRSL